MANEKPSYKALENEVSSLKMEILKLSEKSDKISDAKYRKMIGSIGDVIVIIDSEGLNKYQSPNIEKFLGWKPEEVIGKSTFENVHAEDLEFTHKFIGTLISEPGVIKTIELRHKCKDGSFRWIEFTGCNLLHDPDINGLLGNYHDITERKKTEQALKESENLYQSLFTNLNSPLSIYEILLSENGEPYDYRFIAVNSTYENTVGLKASDLIGKTLLEVFPETKTSWLQTIKKVCLTGISTTVEDYDEEVDLHVELTVYIPQIGQMAFICPDITVRKKTELKLIENQFQLNNRNEELLRAKEKAEESDRLKSVFLANISHEIRTPMNAIIGFSGCLSDPDITETRRQRFTDIIKERTYDLLRIMDDILDVSKLEASQMNIVELEFDLSVLMNNLYLEYIQKIDNTGCKSAIQLKLSLANEVKNIRIKADSQRIKQVIKKLLDNAFKFTHKGSIEFGCNVGTDSTLVFFVKDTGIGIPREKQKIIFDPFRQAEENLLTHSYGGTGLGLSIVKGIVNLMKGKLWLESKEDEGTTFHFTTPLVISGINEENSIDPTPL
ncbi:MAG: PAS domain S-box protein [Bacteroidetes bacterium]|nr:PAS domain S-box protein [Bacteroidota bacterium]